MDIDLTEILEAPTVIRPEVSPSNEPKEETEITDFSGLEFSSEPAPAPEDEPVGEIDPVEIEIYNAEENAEILVELIDVVNIQTLTPLARWKLTKRQGGKPAVRKMQLLFEKKLNDSELTDPEKREIELYQAYLKDKEELERIIPYTEDEKDSLKKSAVPYLSAHKIKIGGGMAFWTQLAMIQGSRIMQVLTA